MTPNRIPDWVHSLSMTKAVAEILGSDDKILAILPDLSAIRFRNCTILLPIKVKVMLKDQTIKKVSFILKAQNNRSKFQAKIMSQFKMFVREQLMYNRILPKLEMIFSSAGKRVSFGPRVFHLDASIGVSYILLEDLKSRGFKNVEHREGLNSLRLKAVLRKLAEFHAASAAYVERYGKFSKQLTIGVFNKRNYSLLKELNNADSFLTQLRRWHVGLKFSKRLTDKEKVLVDRMMEQQTVKLKEFKVLNHSDCWINNIMFKYDGFGNIEDINLIDFQVVKYGSPAYDLFYTILSSAQRDIKLYQFDSFVQFYFYHLLDNLQVLSYKSPMPQLGDIQNALSRNGLAAYVVVTRVLPIVLLNQFEDESNDGYASKMKCSMFTNRKYIREINEILPWLDSRGLLDW